MRLFAESFYYFAARVRTILRNKEHPFPGLDGFECAGVRNCRNMLIEHPEKGDSGILIQSFGYGGDGGPVLKAVRLKGQEDVFRDRGLYRNAEEFRTNLERLLNTAIAQM